MFRASKFRIMNHKPFVNCPPLDRWVLLGSSLLLAASSTWYSTCWRGAWLFVLLISTWHCGTFLLRIAARIFIWIIRKTWQRIIAAIQCFKDYAMYFSHFINSMANKTWKKLDEIWYNMAILDAGEVKLEQKQPHVGQIKVSSDKKWGLYESFWGQNIPLIWKLT